MIESLEVRWVDLLEEFVEKACLGELVKVINDSGMALHSPLRVDPGQQVAEIVAIRHSYFSNKNYIYNYYTKSYI